MNVAVLSRAAGSPGHSRRSSPRCSARSGPWQPDLDGVEQGAENLSAPSHGRIMDPSCLQFSLTPKERQHLQEQGYLVVPEALDRAMTARLNAAVGRVDARERTPDHGRDRLLSFANILPEDNALVDLIDWPRVLPTVWGLLGWNIYVYHTHLDVTPPLAEPPARPVAWHQDSMRVDEEIEGHPRPRLSLKVGYYLTDVSGSDSGNTLLLPGSHLQDELDC